MYIYSMSKICLHIYSKNIVIAARKKQCFQCFQLNYLSENTQKPRFDFSGCHNNIFNQIIVCVFDQIPLGILKMRISYSKIIQITKRIFCVFWKSYSFVRQVKQIFLTRWRWKNLVKFNKNASKFTINSKKYLKNQNISIANWLVIV